MYEKGDLDLGGASVLAVIFTALFGSRPGGPSIPGGLLFAANCLVDGVSSPCKPVALASVFRTPRKSTFRFGRLRGGGFRA
mmetsp:Transcript_31825/g.47299  ORF Transcript_31825/g.47299 Transcript_31825/m.47299 type:complete len:81 (-) Transcript_31825:339-581(-)